MPPFSRASTTSIARASAAITPLRVIAAPDAGEIAERVVAALAGTGKTAVNLRVHVPGVDPDQARRQIVALGEEVVPVIRSKAGTTGWSRSGGR